METTISILSNHVTKATAKVQADQEDLEILEQRTEPGADPGSDNEGSTAAIVADPEPGSAGPRILLVGDSWAEFQWSYSKKTPFRDALAEKGFSRNLVAGEVTALGATLADNWQKAEPGIAERSYADLRTKLRAGRSIGLHQQIASLHAITETLQRYPLIDMVHLSLGGNDLMGKDVPVLAEAGVWQEIWHRDPVSPARYSPDELRAFGWRRSITDLSAEEQSNLTAAQNGLTAKMPAVAAAIAARVDRVVKHIHAFDPKIRVYVIGYTPLFINPLSPRPIEKVIEDLDFNEEEKKKPRQEQKLRKPAGYYSATSVGMQFEYFNAVVLAALERERKRIYGTGLSAARSNALFQCYFFEPPHSDLSESNVADYYSNKKYENDDYFKKIRDGSLFTSAYLGAGDGFHLTPAGYQEVAEHCIEYLYKEWLGKPSTRATV